jgi:hypothetical protein
MPKTQIILPTRLTPPHLRAVLKYFEATNRLHTAEWKLALEAFDLLGSATVVTGKQRKSFRQFYESKVERRYAQRFLTALLAADDPAATGEELQRQTAAALLADLEQTGRYHEDVVDSEYLAAYCLYWWASFARGYRFEAAVLRDLRAAGIGFVAHDLRLHDERLSPYDLIVNRRLGDIKHTTYFLHTARALPLHCDFYITRLYDARRRRYVQIVLLTEAAWHELNGPVMTATLETAADVFPASVRIVFEEQRFIVVTFGLWKELVRRRQQQES